MARRIQIAQALVRVRVWDSRDAVAVAVAATDVQNPRRSGRRCGDEGNSDGAGDNDPARWTSDAGRCGDTSRDVGWCRRIALSGWAGLALAFVSPARSSRAEGRFPPRQHRTGQDRAGLVDMLSLTTATMSLSLARLAVDAGAVGVGRALIRRQTAVTSSKRDGIAVVHTAGPSQHRFSARWKHARGNNISQGKLAGSRLAGQSTTIRKTGCSCRSAVDCCRWARYRCKRARTIQSHVFASNISLLYYIFSRWALIFTNKALYSILCRSTLSVDACFLQLWLSTDS